MPTANGDNVVGFVAYNTDYLFYKQLQKEGRIKKGEFTTYMRKCFRDFLEEHRHTPARLEKPLRVPNSDNAVAQLKNIVLQGNPETPMGHYKPQTSEGVAIQKEG